jgi:hypothetical protein
LGLLAPGAVEALAQKIDHVMRDDLGRIAAGMISDVRPVEPAHQQQPQSGLQLG